MYISSPSPTYHMTRQPIAKKGNNKSHLDVSLRRARKGVDDNSQNDL